MMLVVLVVVVVLMMMQVIIIFFVGPSIHFIEALVHVSCMFISFSYD